MDRDDIRTALDTVCGLANYRTKSDVSMLVYELSDRIDSDIPLKEVRAISEYILMAYEAGVQRAQDILESIEL